MNTEWTKIIVKTTNYEYFFGLSQNHKNFKIPWRDENNNNIKKKLKLASKRRNHFNHLVVDIRNLKSMIL